VIPPPIIVDIILITKIIEFDSTCLKSTSYTITDTTQNKTFFVLRKFKSKPPMKNMKIGLINAFANILS